MGPSVPGEETEPHTALNAKAQPPKGHKPGQIGGVVSGRPSDVKSI